jgi:predicted nucleotidyltransferase
MKKSDKEPPEKKEKIKKTIAKDVKKIDNLKDFYQERLNQLAEKINENLSIDELEEIHKEFSYLSLYLTLVVFRCKFLVSKYLLFFN